jgi:hypothetical protein
MIRSIIVALAVLLAAPTYATTTWAVASSSATRSVKATCTTGSEAAPSATPSALAPVGVNLDTVAAVFLYLQAGSGQTVASGWIQCYLYSPLVATWATLPVTYALSSTAVRTQSPQGDSPGIGIPVIGMRGWLACVPSSVTVSSGNVTMWMLAVGADGSTL